MFFGKEIWFKRSISDINTFSCSLRSTAVFRALYLGLQCAGSEMYAWNLFCLIISKSDLRKQTCIYFVLFTARIPIPTVNASTKKCTQYNKFMTNINLLHVSTPGPYPHEVLFIKEIETQHANRYIKILKYTKLVNIKSQCCDTKTYSVSNRRTNTHLDRCDPKRSRPHEACKVCVLTCMHSFL